MENSAYFEDVKRNIDDPFVKENKNTLFSNWKEWKEVYFTLNNAGKDYIQKMLIATDQGWHSLCILSPWLPPLHDGKSEICFIAAADADYLITSAYDSEGYVIWERNRYKGRCKTFFSQASEQTEERAGHSD